jgi:hypothetical protein
LCGQKETRAPAIRAQPLTDVGDFLLGDLRVLAHEPETAGVKLLKRLLRQRQFLRLGQRRGKGCRFFHANLIPGIGEPGNSGKQTMAISGNDVGIKHLIKQKNFQKRKMKADQKTTDYGLLDQRATPRTSRLVMVATILLNFPASRSTALIKPCRQANVCRVGIIQIP